MITYSHKNGLGPTMVEPQPEQSPDRYLTPDDRDFMAVFAKVPVGHRAVQVVSAPTVGPAA